MGAHSKMMRTYVQLDDLYGDHPVYCKFDKAGDRVGYCYYHDKGWKIARKVGCRKCSISTTSPAKRPDKAKSIWYEARGPNGKAMQGHPGIVVAVVKGGSPESTKRSGMSAH